MRNQGQDKEYKFSTSNRDLVIRRLKDAEWQSSEFGEKWNGLLGSSTRPNVFSSWDWAMAWWKNYGGQARSQVLAIYSVLGELVGIAPLYFISGHAFGILPYKSLHIIGDHSAGSEYLGLITAPSFEFEVAECIMSYFTEYREQPHVYHFSGMRNDSMADSLLIELLDSSHGRLFRYTETCSYIALPNNYEEYINTLSKKFRWNVLYQERRIRKDLEMRVIITEQEEQINSQLERLFQLHTSRWAQRKLPGSFRSEKKRAFYRDVSLRFLKRGWLLFFHLKLDGVIRACNYGFRYGGRFYELQTGYDVEFEKQYKGLGVVLKAHAIEHCIKGRLTTYDFLGGSEDFKTRWGTKTEITTTVKYYPPGVWTWLTYMGTDGIVKLKQYLKKVTVGETWDFDVLRARLLWSIRHPLTKRPGRTLVGEEVAHSKTGNSEASLEADGKE